MIVVLVMNCFAIVTKIVPLLVLIMGEARAVFTVMKGDASRYESIVLIYGKKREKDLCLSCI